MFSFFKRDNKPPQQPPQQQQQNVKKQPPSSQQQQQQQQQPAIGKKSVHQDPLIAGGVSSVFAPSATSLQQQQATTTTTRVPPPPNAALSSLQGTGNPKVDRLELPFGDFYSGEVTYSLPSEIAAAAAAAASNNNNSSGGGGGDNTRSSTSAATRASILSARGEQPKAVPNGLGELQSDRGRHTYTGFFVNGQRDGQGQLVTSKYMIWAFWKANQVDVTSSVRMDSLETLVKYRGFVKPANDPRAVRMEPNKYSSFSLWVAATTFVRDGWGEAVYPDGRHVFGRWENDELCGFGTQMTPDGERYIGMFHNSKFHGFGVLFLPNGAVCEGDWLNGGFKNQNGSVTIPGRCILTGHFNDRASFSRVGMTLLDTSNHSSEDIDIGLGFVSRQQYESLFFWATNSVVIREEATQHVLPILNQLDSLIAQNNSNNNDPQVVLKAIEKEIRLKLIKTKRFDNAVRVAQRVIFFQYGSCGSPSHVRSGCGRATLGVLPSALKLDSNNNTSSSSSKNNNDRSSSKTTTTTTSGKRQLSARAAPAKATPANQAVGWCETQKCGGCIHQGSGSAITPQTARNLFDDMLSFSASCRKFWSTLLTTAKDIKSKNEASKKSGVTSQEQQEAGGGGGEDESDYYYDDELVSDTDLLNIISRASFDAIFGTCRKLAINVFCHAFYFEQNAAEAALERLRDVTLNDVGINFARQSDDSLFDIYADATRALEGAFASQVPTEILHGLHRWSQSIDSATRETAEAAAGSADDLIPIHQFVLLRAKIPHLVPMTKLVSWLGEQPCFVEPTSAESFCLTTLQACVAMLHDLRSNIRDTAGVLQSPSALEARVDDTLSLLEDQMVPFPLVRRAADYCSNILVQFLGHRLEFLHQLRNELTTTTCNISSNDTVKQNEGEEEEGNKKEKTTTQEGGNNNNETEFVFLLPPGPLHASATPSSSSSSSGDVDPVALAAAAAAVSATSASGSGNLASAGNSSSSSSSIPLQSRPRGRSITSAPVNKTLDEQLLHALALLLDAIGCTLVIATVSISDSLQPNRLVCGSNVIVASKKNNFGVKEAFLSSSSFKQGNKFCFCARVPASLLRSSPILKIYANKFLSF